MASRITYCALTVVMLFLINIAAVSAGVNKNRQKPQSVRIESVDSIYAEFFPENLDFSIIHLNGNTLKFVKENHNRGNHFEFIADSLETAKFKQLAKSAFIDSNPILGKRSDRICSDQPIMTVEFYSRGRCVKRHRICYEIDYDFSPAYLEFEKFMLNQCSAAPIKARIKEIFSEVPKYFCDSAESSSRERSLEYRFCTMEFEDIASETFSCGVVINQLNWSYWIMGQECRDFWIDNIHVIRLDNEKSATVALNIHNQGWTIPVQIELRYQKFIYDGDWFIDNIIRLSPYFDWKYEMKKYLESQNTRVELRK